MTTQSDPLPSPVPATPSTATTDDLPLTEFLALSTVLTGVANLNPAVGRIDWQSLQASDEFAIGVADLYICGYLGFWSEAWVPVLD